jgi:saccharopine dehydrogenase-like NADP-dependent oxidoreductase
VDPGVDHLWAIKTIDEAHKAGGKIRSFYSYCGGESTSYHGATEHG